VLALLVLALLVLALLVLALLVLALLVLALLVLALLVLATFASTPSSRSNASLAFGALVSRSASDADFAGASRRRRASRSRKEASTTDAQG
jgi:hypothetical protein